jgi:hypothetical protein
MEYVLSWLANRKLDQSKRSPPPTKPARFEALTAVKMALFLSVLMPCRYQRLEKHPLKAETAHFSEKMASP